MARATRQLSREGGVQHEQHTANLVPYLIPVFCALGLYITAMVVRLVLATDAYAWYWSLFTAALYTTFSYVAWRASRPRGVLMCALVTLAASLGCGWSWWVAGVPGDLTWRPIVAYFGGALLFCACSWLLSGLRHGTTEWNPLAERMRRALDGVRNTNAMAPTERGTLRAELEMEPGEVLEDLDRKRLASAMDIPVSGVRLSNSAESARRGTLELDPASTNVPAEPWSGPSQPFGSSILLPAIVGYGPGGQPAEWFFSGDESKDRNLAHVLVGGMNGAGKSAGLRQLLIEGMTRKGFTYAYGNGRKAEQEPDWVLQGAEAVATTNKEVAGLLKWIRDVETPRRVKLLGSTSYKARHDQWHPDAFDELGLPFLLVLLDEFAGVAQDVERVATDLGETLRSLGVQLVPVSQSASGRRLPTDFRRQLPGRWCFGMATGEDDEMMLGDIDEMEGCTPSSWANRQPGMHYLVVPGTEATTWPVAKRTQRADKATLNAWGERLVALRRGGNAPAPPVPAQAAQGAATAVSGGTPAELVVPAPSEMRPVDEDDVAVDEIVQSPEEFACDSSMSDEAVAAMDELDDDEDNDEEDSELDEAAAAVERALAGPELTDLGEVGPTPIPPGDPSEGVLHFRRPVSRMTDEEARAYLREFVIDLGRQGVPFIKADSEAFERLLERTARGGSWLRKWLDRMCEEEVPLLRKRGARLGYDVLPAPARAGVR